MPDQFGQNIWVPESHTDRAAILLEAALQRYDEKLKFGRNMDTGQWCIFVKMPRGHGFPELWPVIGWNTIPDPDEALARLRQTDTLRYGQDIRQRLEKQVAAIRNASEYEADQGSARTAEAMESFYHRQGRTGYHRSLPKRDPKQRSSA